MYILYIHIILLYIKVKQIEGLLKLDKFLSRLHKVIVLVKFRATYVTYVFRELTQIK